METQGALGDQAGITECHIPLVIQIAQIVAGDVSHNLEERKENVHDELELVKPRSETYANGGA